MKKTHALVYKLIRKLPKTIPDVTQTLDFILHSKFNI